ncbi:MAG: molecular chaperone DnaJ, partial [Candidatus Hydrogenedentes bacterium]|nr:molecular chaperone DnaJ [Candidatus Hydrogenedentota bacterium]
ENGGPRGDLHIYIEVQQDELFVREGADVLCEVPVSFPKAVLGATIRVPTLTGEAELKVPAGTQSGAILRLRGIGMPDLRGYRQGDELVRIVVEVPTRLTRRQRELMQEFEKENDENDSKAYPLYRRFMDKLKKFQGG